MSILNQKEIVVELNVLDSKCGSLLQLAAIVLAIGTIPVSLGKLSGPMLGVAVFIAADFLIISLLLLSLLWYVRVPSDKLLNDRIRLYHFALMLTAFGLLAMGTLFFLLLR